MKFDVNATVDTDVTCDFIGIYPRESKAEVVFKLGIDREVRRALVSTDVFLTTQARKDNFTLDLSRAVVAAVKDLAKVDKNASDIVVDFWETENV